jgi:hypothetical protein
VLPPPAKRAYVGREERTTNLLLLVARLLIGFLVLVRFVMAYCATNGSSCQAMMSSKMAGDATHHSPFDATLGISGKYIERQSHSQPGGAYNVFHRISPFSTRLL